MRSFLTQVFKLLFLVSLLCISLIGQNQNLHLKTFTDYLNSQQNTIPNQNDLILAEIDGTPYLNKEFTLGSIITNENIHYQDIPLRYNIYNDDIEFKVDDSKYLAISNPTSIKELRIGQNTFIYDKLITRKKNTYGYYQIAVQGRVKLLIRYHTVYKETETSVDFPEQVPPAFIRRPNTYIIKVETGTLFKISKKKDLTAIFGNESKEMLVYIKKERINLRKQDQLIKLVQFFNEVK